MSVPFTTEETNILVLKKAAYFCLFSEYCLGNIRALHLFYYTPPFLRPFFPPVSFSATHKSTQENNKHEMDGKGSQV